MLYDLGLFKGTDKGLCAGEIHDPRRGLGDADPSAWRRKDRAGRKLESSVYRCAAMGGQIRRLAVSEWFDQGRFRDTVRLAAQCHLRPVLHFSDQAHLDADSYQGTAFVDNDEVQQDGRRGFIRGDAVSLSARLLSTNYAKNGDESDRSVAEKLIDNGVFTAEQFKNAAWDVLPRDYSNDYQYDGKWNLIASPFVCQIADVTVAVSD